MKVKALINFRDKDNYNLQYEVGKTYDFEKQRADYLIELGFVELVKEKTK